ncbi:MAG: hemerythrin domain-containing protein [Gammaproteobacteria bacterium]
MQVTNDLMNEHQLILKYISLMEQYIKFSLANQNEQLFSEKAEVFIGFIRNFADTFHHAKEEDILFKHMEAPGVLSHCNPLPQMLLEHEQGRQFVQGMKSAVESADLDNLINNAGNYGALLKEHIFKEDNILYPMAEAGIPNEDKSPILDEYKKAEERLDSQAVWIEYEEKYKELENCLNERQLKKCINS